MNIIKFIKNLLPTTERASVRSSLVNATQEFTRFNKPAFESATKEFGSLKFKSGWNNAFEKDLDKVASIRTRGNSIATLEAINKLIEPYFAEVANLLDEYFGEDFSNESITVQRYNILQFIEALMFYVEYSRRWLNVTVRKETNLSVKSVGGENDGILPVDLEWLGKHRDAFLKVVKILTTKSKNLTKTIEDLPEFTVTSGTTIARNQHEVDPMGFGYISSTMNPFLFIRLERARLQVAALQAAELEAQELEFRILALRAALDGNPDAKKEALANALEQNRLRPLRMKIEQLTAEYENV